jgi:hypothetical protein
VATSTAVGGREALAIYLNDHLLGATGGVELARRIADTHKSSARSATFERLATEIAEDRESLTRIMGDLGIRVDQVKVAAGWVGEKVGRLKLNGRLFSRSDLSSVVELEGMSLGVEGKAAGWRSLRAVAEVDDRVDAKELDALIERADRQSEELEELRMQAAATVFIAGPR